MGVEDTWRLRDGETPSARDGRGKRYRVRKRGHPTKSFRTRREAERHWASIIATPLPVQDDTTVGELLDMWLAGKAGLSPKGRTAAEGAARHVRSRWQDVPAVEVHTSDAQAWIAGLTVERGPKDARRRVPASASLLHKVAQAFAGAMEIGVDRGVVEANPVTRVRVPSERPREARYLAPTELRRVADAAEHWGAAVWLLGTTGVRVGEAAALDVGDVQTDRRRLRIRRSKTGRGRDVPVPATVLGMLDLDRPGDAPLLVSPRGARLDVRNFRRALVTAASSVGIEMTVHDLRHTAASLAIASGADVKAVQAMLGHATATMTLDRYAHLFDSGLDDVASRMDRML